MSLILNSPSRTYEVYSIDTDASEFLEFEEFVTLWRSKMKGRFLPAWKDFELEDFAPWWGNLMVLDFYNNPFDFRYRLWGTNLAELHQLDITNMRTADLKKIGQDCLSDLAFYEHIASNVVIGRNFGHPRWVNREHIATSYTDLPLSDNGRSVTHCMSLLI